MTHAAGARSIRRGERGEARLLPPDFDAPLGAPVHLSFDPARLHGCDRGSGRRRAAP